MNDHSDPDMTPDEMSEMMMNAMNNILRQSTTTSSSKPTTSTQQKSRNVNTQHEEQSFYHVGDRVVIPGGYSALISPLMTFL